MKFRSRLSKNGLSFFLTSIQTITRLSGDGAFLLDPTHVRLTALTVSIDSPHAYLELAIASLFTDYRIESQSENRIAFEINLHLLIKALSSAKQATSTVLKLAKIGNLPCLNLRLDSEDSMYGMTVSHDLPIKLIKVTEELTFISPPDISPPTVALTLTKSKLLKTIVERLNKFGKIVEIHASQTGSLQLRVLSSGANILTLVQGLKPSYSISEDQSNRLNKEDHANNQVDTCVHIRKLTVILDYQNMLYNEATLCK